MNDPTSGAALPEVTLTEDEASRVGYPDLALPFDLTKRATIERCAQVVENLKREVPYDYNQRPCRETMRRAASTIRALATNAPEATATVIKERERAIAIADRVALECEADIGHCGDDDIAGQERARGGMIEARRIANLLATNAPGVRS